MGQRRRAWLDNAWAASRAGFNSVQSANGSRRNTPSIGSACGIRRQRRRESHNRRSETLQPRRMVLHFRPAGGVTDGWQLAMRSRNINGPLVKYAQLWHAATATSTARTRRMGTDANGDDWFIHFQTKLLRTHNTPEPHALDFRRLACHRNRQGRRRMRHAPAQRPQARTGSDDSRRRVNTVETSVRMACELFRLLRFPTLRRSCASTATSPHLNSSTSGKCLNRWLMKFPAEKFCHRSLQVSAKADAEGVALRHACDGLGLCPPEPRETRRSPLSCA